MDTIKNISIVFTSIFFESLPFLLLGSLISSIIETYISNETLSKLIPKNKILGSIVGIFLGLFLPACDCAVIPISKRLVKKKVPINVAISFMLASPIINPVVLLSTYYAFYKTNPEIFWYRLLFGIIIAFIIGIIMGLIYDGKNVIISEHECDDCSCHNHDKIINVFDMNNKHSLKKDLLSIFKHTSYDLFDVVKYLMFGALIASIVQVILPRNILMLFTENKILSIIILMSFAYLISLCSTSDSFVGKTFINNFSKESIIAYLLLGPMIDIKNTIVLYGNYKKKFVLTLILLIFVMIFIFSLIGVSIL